MYKKFLILYIIFEYNVITLTIFCLLLITFWKLTVYLSKDMEGQHWLISLIIQYAEIYTFVSEPHFLCYHPARKVMQVKIVHRPRYEWYHRRIKRKDILIDLKEKSNLEPEMLKEWRDTKARNEQIQWELRDERTCTEGQKERPADRGSDQRRVNERHYRLVMGAPSRSRPSSLYHPLHSRPSLLPHIPIP